MKTSPQKLNLHSSIQKRKADLLTDLIDCNDYFNHNLRELQLLDSQWRNYNIYSRATSENSSSSPKMNPIHEIPDDNAE
ncbi:unnamed protein product [Caenorhabditis nigoni]